MLEVLKLRLKQNYIILSLMGLALLVFKTGVMDTSFVCTLLVWFFLYRINVEEKIKKNWNYFESLPLSMWERAGIQILLPLLIVFLVFVLSTDQPPILYLLSENLKDDVEAAVFLTTASVVGTSLIGFIGSYFALSLVANIFGSITGLSFLLMALSIGYCLYSFSGKRMNIKANLIAGVAASVVATIAIIQLRPAVYRPFLSHNDSRISLFAATTLIEKYQDAEAKKHLEDRLFTITDSRELDDVLDAFSESDLKLDLSVGQVGHWIKTSSSRNQDVILDYFRRDRNHYSWMDQEFLASLEPSIWSNRDECEDACHSLARMMADRPDDVDWETIKTYLLGQNSEKIDYGLEVIEHSEKKVLTEEVVSLLKTGNEDIREHALEILLEWSEDSMEERGKEIKAILKEDFSEETAEKAQEFFLKTVR